MPYNSAGGAGDAVIEYTSGSTWVDLGCWASDVSMDAWDRVTGSVNVLCVDEAVMGFGKLTLTGITVNGLYTDGASGGDLVDTLYTQHTATGGGMFMIRVSPQGTASGKAYIETNDDAKIDSFTPVSNIDAASGDPIMLSFHVATSGWDMGTN
jgi:hypothetical protein